MTIPDPAALRKELDAWRTYGCYDELHKSWSEIIDAARWALDLIEGGNLHLETRGSAWGLQVRFVTDWQAPKP